MPIANRTIFLNSHYFRDRDWFLFDIFMNVFCNASSTTLETLHFIFLQQLAQTRSGLQADFLRLPQIEQFLFIVTLRCLFH